MFDKAVTLPQAVSEPLVQKAIDSPAVVKLDMVCMRCIAVGSFEKCAMPQVGCYNFSQPGIMVYPDTQVRLSDQYTIFLAKLVGQKQLTGIAATLDDAQM